MTLPKIPQHYFVLILLLVSLFFLAKHWWTPASSPAPSPTPRPHHWPIRAIDTMKQSRDLAKEKLTSRSYSATVRQLLAAVRETGANYVALGTPYDAEFNPYLRMWVSAAREAGLQVWFRGNFSGWEGWFDYPRLSRQDHLSQLARFLADNPDLFAPGDIFTPCPECENGGPGDPRQTGDVDGFRRFLISEYELVNTYFASHQPGVKVGYFSMNYDVAKLVMDPATTRAVGGVVVIDHYVADPLRLATDVTALAAKSGGRVVLGEFGAPIPDLHGSMTPESQARWLDTALASLTTNQSLDGLNYWVAQGGSTALWDRELAPRPGVEVLRTYFTKMTYKD